MHLSVPDSFLDTKISETIPIAASGPKVPEYVFYSLDEDMGKSDTENDENDKKRNDIDIKA